MRWTEISEARQAPLYHFMESDKAVPCFRVDAMGANWIHVIDGERVKGNSFTRNAHYNHNRPIRLTMNQMVLATRHKIIPLDGERTFRNTMYHDDVRHFPDTELRVSNVRDRQMNSRIGSELTLSEEFVVGDIAPLSRAITLIEITQPCFRGHDTMTLVAVTKAYGEKYGIEVVINPKVIENIERIQAMWDEDEDTQY